MTFRRTSRYWLPVALVMAFAVCAPTAEGLGRSAPAASATSVRVGSLTVAVPRGFSRHDFHHGGHLVGVLVTDYRVPTNSPTLTEGLFPTHGVALILERAAGPRVAAPLLRLPLSLDQLGGPQHHADGTAWNGVLRFRGSLYTISFWLGQTAPPHDRAALLRALTLIHSTP